MSWLRIDDGFGDHPKLLMLTRSERWTFVELLCYCARHRTDGYFPSSIAESRRYITPTFLTKCVEFGLIDEAPDGDLKIHDWEIFNPAKDPTGAVRQQRWRNANTGSPQLRRNGESNGDRNEPVTENVTAVVTPSRARDPVPSRPVPTEGSPVNESPVQVQTEPRPHELTNEVATALGEGLDWRSP